MGAHLLPEFVGVLCAHGLPQDLERFLFIEDNDREVFPADHGSQSAMVAIDHRRADSIRQGDYDPEALVRRNVVHMPLFDVRPAEPLFEVIGSGGDERMPCGNLPSDGDAELQAPYLEILLAGYVFAISAALAAPAVSCPFGSPLRLSPSTTGRRALEAKSVCPTALSSKYCLLLRREYPNWGVIL